MNPKIAAVKSTGQSLQRAIGCLSALPQICRINLQRGDIDHQRMVTVPLEDGSYPCTSLAIPVMHRLQINSLWSQRQYLTLQDHIMLYNIRDQFCNPIREDTSFNVMVRPCSSTMASPKGERQA